MTSRSSVTLRVSHHWHRDMRGPLQLAAAAAMEQQRADERLEREWRERVRSNELRRIQRKRPRLVGLPGLQRQAG